MSRSKKTRKVSKQKRKLTAAEKRARRERKQKYKIIFVNGRQKRVPREPMIGGLPVDEFIARNADPIWLVQNELWELIPTQESPGWQCDDRKSASDDAATNEAARSPVRDEGNESPTLNHRDTEAQRTEVRKISTYYTEEHR